MDAMNDRYGIASDERSRPGAGMSPAEPQSMEELGLPSLFLGNLTLKHCFFMDFFTLADLAERLKVSPAIMSEVLEYLKKSKWVEVRGPDPMQMMRGWDRLSG
jgi:DNA-binding MarR family transcriptional regulator